MRPHIKKNLENLSKEQLIYIINQLYSFYNGVGNMCLSVSKMHLEPNEAINDIRELCNDIQYDVKLRDEHIGDYINMKLGKITPEELRKIILGIDNEENND